MLPTVISTQVSQSAITKVGRLFNGTPDDVLNELLQNARRAGSTSVVISLDGAAGGHVLRVNDDGTGIDDPASVVTLGRSDWDDDTRRREDPAGMGVFSLAGRRVALRSYSRTAAQGWTATIDGDAWESRAPIRVLPDDIERGTEIAVDVPEHWTGGIKAAVARTAAHYPLPVIFDGEAVTQSDWLDEARYVEAWQGCRIGIYRSDRHSTADPTINFHGVTVACKLPTVQEVDRGGTWFARIDIDDMPSLHLVLPARKEVVENAATLALRGAVEAAIYRAIGSEPYHRLSFANWTRARELGVELPEAASHLNPWTAPTSGPVGIYHGSPHVRDGRRVIVPDVDPFIGQPLERALRRKEALPIKFVEEQDRFQGYGWYDALPTVKEVTFRVRAGEKTGSISLFGADQTDRNATSASSS